MVANSFPELTRVLGQRRLNALAFHNADQTKLALNRILPLSLLLPRLLIKTTCRVNLSFRAVRVFNN